MTYNEALRKALHEKRAARGVDETNSVLMHSTLAKGGVEFLDNALLELEKWRLAVDLPQMTRKDALAMGYLAGAAHATALRDGPEAANALASWIDALARADKPEEALRAMARDELFGLTTEAIREALMTKAGGKGALE